MRKFFCDLLGQAKAALDIHFTQREQDFYSGMAAMLLLSLLFNVARVLLR